MVGAGYIGLEVAAVAATKGLKVTVLEAVDRVMARVVCPEVSKFYFDCHTRYGVDIRCGTMIDGFIGNGHVEAVSAADGETVPLRPGHRRHRHRAGGGTGFEARV